MENDFSFPQQSQSGDVPAAKGDFVGRDKLIQGDEVHGDKYVTYQLPSSFRIPLQRPARASHFQDRKDDLDQLLADLQPGEVVTLCGPGGIGKSALAAEAAWQLAPGAEPPSRFPDGILFHSFYNQSQALLALEHIAHSFGEEIRPTPKEAAQRALAGRCALLILDGTEQADDLRQVVDIRDQCGVLITSRTRNDEVDIRKDIAPLPLHDAVMLLQAWGGARAEDTNAVSDIAELVGRLPLALRLVGRYLSQNEENAGDYLAWLQETPLIALDQGQRRGQSVSLLLAHSLEQVTEQARQILGVIGLLALAPFGYEPIGSAMELPPAEARKGLGELVSYGLLIRAAENYEITHALLHTYARERLSPTTEVLDRLANYYKQVIHRNQSDFPYLNTLRPHVMALIRIANEKDSWHAVSILAWSIHHYLHLQGYWTDHIQIAEVALSAARATQNRKEEGVWLSRLGSTYRFFGQIEQAIQHYQNALVIAREIGELRDEGISLGNLGFAYNVLGQFERSVEYLTQALDIDRRLGNRWSESSTLNSLGVVYTRLGKAAEAIEYHLQALTIARETRNRIGEGWCQQNLGRAYYALEKFTQAIDYFEQSLAIAKEVGDLRGEGYRLSNLGGIYSRLGEIERAIDYYKQAVIVTKATDDRLNQGYRLRALGNLHRELGQFEQAKQYWEEALHIFEEINSPNAEKVLQLLASLQGQ